MRAEKKVTIDDVAAACGVSKTTISRFLNGKNENISELTRERIAHVIDKLNYKPNRSAQRLKSRKSFLIGCVIGDIGSPFAGILIKGINAVFNQAGYQVMLADSAEDPDRERAAIEEFLENRVDGLIVNSAGGNDDYLVAIDQKTPVVLADRGLVTPYRLDAVVSPNREKAYECVSYLLACGYTQIAFFTEGNKSITPRIERFEGYCKAVHDLMPEGTVPIEYEYNRTDTSCRDAVNDFRNRFPGERIAVICVNGVVTQHVLFAIRENEITIGEQFGIISFDDWKWFQLTPPGITSVAMGSEEIGIESAKLLLDRLLNPVDNKDSHANHIILPAKIVSRGSTVYVETQK